MDSIELLTVEQAAKKLQVSVKTIRRLIAAGDIVTTRAGRQIRIRAVHLDEYLTRGESRSQPVSAEMRIWVYDRDREAKRQNGAKSKTPSATGRGGQKGERRR